MAAQFREPGTAVLRCLRRTLDDVLPRYQRRRVHPLTCLMVLLSASMLSGGQKPGDAPAEHPHCTAKARVPVTLDMTTDELSIAVQQPTTVSVVITATAALRDVKVRCRGEGHAEIQGEQDFDYDFLGPGQIIELRLTALYRAAGLSRVVVQVSAVGADSGFAFARRADLNVLIEDERAFAGLEVPRHLRVRSLRERAGRGELTADEADAGIKELTRLDGTFDQVPFQWVAPRPDVVALPPLVDPPAVDESPADKPSAPSGGVSIRVMGLVQWRDENNDLHPAFGMNVQVRDDETVGSELVRNLATDANGQYDTGFFNHDDGLGAGNPDIFVRFRTENAYVDVEDGCTFCGTYENNSPIHDEFPGGTIIENFTCANTGTGPACSVLTGMTWIASYTANLNGGTPLDNIRVDWPDPGGATNYTGGHINLHDGERWDWDVQHHEYGHYVMDEFDFENNPGGPHNVSACHAVGRSNKDEGNRLAWGEGWPTYFGTAGQQVLNMASLNVPRVGDVNYTDTIDQTFTYSLEANSGGQPPTGTTFGAGEDNELAVQRILWDLFDTNDDSRDTVSLSDAFLFTLFDVAGPHTLNAIRVAPECRVRPCLRW